MFLKKLALCFGLILFLAMARPVLAQDSLNLNQITTEQLNMEGPLTQADIDFFVKFMTFSTELMNKPQAPNAPEIDEEKETLDFIKANNFTPVRLRYLMEKIVITISQIKASPQDLEKFNSANTPPYLKSSDAEKQIVQGNLNNILTAFQKIQEKN
ncbi:MAG: hypothetical protein LBT86_08640 [Deltaproteobacteria bacterium]|jgi:hypothetical protein|nr:hypothetical protein [Deltaproteobacteria bacterium]